MKKFLKNIIKKIPIFHQLFLRWNYLIHRLNETDLKLYQLTEKNNLYEETLTKLSDALNLQEETLTKLSDALNLLDYRLVFTDNRVTQLFLQKKIQNGEKIRIAFFVIYESAFPAKLLFEAMQKDDLFEPFIVVIPDVFRGDENMLFQMEKTYSSLYVIYDSYVKKSYNTESKLFIDFSNSYDIFWSANIYDCMTHEYYSIKFNTMKNKLALYTTYGFCISNWFLRSISYSSEYNYTWKIFSETEIHNKILTEILKTNGYNLVSLGYCKMDALAKIKSVPRSRKKIIIAPHHTVVYWKDGLNLSNFLQYADFFLELPKLYPKIDFVFRPHPLLFPNLVNNNIWSKQDVETYLVQLQENANILYDTSADYFDLFVNSDALIHDCGSFLAEYLFLDHPCCYMINEKTQEDLNQFAIDCLDCCYHAYTKEDIVLFINKVILGEDSMSDRRLSFSNNNLKKYYPNSTITILEYLKKIMV